METELRNLDIAIASCFVCDNSDPDLAFRRLADAGATRVNWCHHWSVPSYLYTPAEMRQYAQSAQKYGLKILSVHGAACETGCWYEYNEDVRRAGIIATRNRMQLFRELGAYGALVMHVPFHSEAPSQDPEADRKEVLACKDAVKKSLDELQPYARELGVQIAIENMPYDTFEVISELLEEYPADYVGLCYDCGHGNIGPAKGLDYLEKHLDRLIALHLHDNDGIRDQHLPPYYGNVDWTRLAKLIQKSTYKHEMDFELNMWFTHFKEQPEAYLKDAFPRCQKVARLVAKV